jgi:hypothetical protein
MSPEQPERTPPPVAVNTVPADQPEASSISLQKIRVPLTSMLSVVVLLLGTIFAVALAWFKVQSHTEAREVHLDQAATTKGGGLAFQMDLVGVEKRTRKMLRSMEINCRAANDSSGTMNCKVYLPEEP